MSNRFYKSVLLGTTVIAGMAFAAPAFAQTQTEEQPAPAPTTAAPEDEEAREEIVVTGSILRRTNTETPSPVTVLSSESLEQRGINTVAEAVQRLSANNAGTIQQGWNTGFNFASGANAPALRGLTVQATLSIADGLRLAPYPLADDGQRNFVDLNTIPNAIIDRIEVLRDGASSTYGADAIAGVINVITKKEIQGLHLGASAGVSQRGDAAERRLDVTWGYGDLDEQGFNFYISGEYQKQDELWARDRGYPFNTSDLSRICNSSGSCLHNLDSNGISPDGFFNENSQVPGITLVRPVTVPGAVTGTGQYSYLNPGAGCRGWEEVDTTGLGTVVPDIFCEVDTQNAYIMLQPQIERKGLSTRFTFNIGDNHQLYAMGNWYRTDNFASFTPANFRDRPTAPRSGAGFFNVIAPVYVCPTGVGTLNGLNTSCDATNGVLNPYNPFAAAGQTAQLSVRSTRPRTVETHARTLRGAIGVNGSFLDDFRYTVDFTASQVQLDRIQSGYLIPQRIMDALARGTFNFFDLDANSEEAWDFISPTKEVRSTSDLWQASATLAKDLFDLPGGPLQAAVGVAYRHEAIDAPSANPQNDAHPYDRYYSLNAVGTSGSRNVKSAFFEIDAPFMTLSDNGFGVEANISGRYDKYSTGQKNFSPKVGVKFTPIKELAIRGTFSKGFRIPSFNEAFGLPTTGFVNRTLAATTPGADAFAQAHGCANFATCTSAYVKNAFSLGLTQTGNPSLDPEKSTSFTAGAVFEPIRNVAFTVDFWNIKIKGLISGVTDTGPAFAAYYTNNGVVNIPGINVLPGVPDPAFPNALPQIGTIESSFQNAGEQVTRGIDFGVNARVNLTDGIRWITSGEASYLMKYELTDGDGNKFRYDGTLSPCNITSCSGAPKWRASWQNTLEFGNTTLTGTLYYTSGYGNESVDFGATWGDCASGQEFGSVVLFPDGTPVRCDAKATWNFDFTASQRIDDRFTIYMNVLNAFDIDAPFDPSAAYSIFQFNPAWAGPNIMGRYFRVGAKVDF